MQIAQRIRLNGKKLWRLGTSGEPAIRSFGKDLRINPPLTVDFTKRFVTVMPILPLRCGVSAPHC